MTSPGRFTLVAPLPALGAFRRALALDRAGAPRPVVLSFVPPELADSPARLEPLLRAVEAAARLEHPGAAAVLGTETVDGALAVVEAHRPGTSLRALLDGAGRTPPDVAARIGQDVAAALARAHALDAGGVPLTHGALDAARIGIGDGGEAFVCGLGLDGGTDPAADVRALGAILHECLAGEPAGEPPRPLDVPGIPAVLAAAVDRASGAAQPPWAGALALADALAAAVAPPATAGDVAAYVDAILAPGEGERADLRRALAAAAGPAREARSSAPQPTGAQQAGPQPAGPQPTGPRQAAPVPTRPAPPASDSARTFARPAPPARTSPAAAVVVGLVSLAVGFAAGFAAQRTLAARSPPAVAPGSIRVQAEPAARAALAPPPAPTPAPAAPPRSAPVRPAEPRPRPAQAAPAPAKPAGKGTLDVTAPADAEVLLDGRRIGRGNIRVEVVAGPHRLEVRRGGASVRERFQVRPGEVWTYDVAPVAPISPAPSGAEAPPAKAP